MVAVHPTAQAKESPARRRQARAARGPSGTQNPSGRATRDMPSTQTIRRRSALTAARVVAVTAAVALALPAGRASAVGQPPPEWAANAGAWPAHNYDLANTRATTQTPINSQTVAQLKVKWTFAFKGTSGFGAFSSTPISLNGTVYLQDLNSNVYALDRTTGQVKWQHVFNKPSVGPNGVAFGDGRIYGATSTDAFALDAQTGKHALDPPVDSQHARGHRHDTAGLRRHRAAEHGPREHLELLRGQRRRHRVGARRCDRPGRSGSSTPSPTAPSSSATPRSTAAAVCGTRRRSTARGACSSPSPTRRRCTGRRSSRTAPAAPARTSTPTRSSPSTARPASGCGSSRRFPTTCATTT